MRGGPARAQRRSIRRHGARVPRLRRPAAPPPCRATTLRCDARLGSCRRKHGRSPCVRVLGPRPGAQPPTSARSGVAKLRGSVAELWSFESQSRTTLRSATRCAWSGRQKRQISPYLTPPVLRRPQFFPNPSWDPRLLPSLRWPLQAETPWKRVWSLMWERPALGCPYYQSSCFLIGQSY